MRIEKWEKWWRHKKLHLWNYGIGWYIQKEQNENCSPAKNQPFSANTRGRISIVMLQWVNINLSEIGLDRKRIDPIQF